MWKTARKTGLKNNKFLLFKRVKIESLTVIGKLNDNQSCAFVCKFLNLTMLNFKYLVQNIRFKFCGKNHLTSFQACFKFKFMLMNC